MTARRRRLLVLGVALVAVAAAGGALALLSGPETEPAPRGHGAVSPTSTEGARPETEATPAARTTDATTDTAGADSLCRRRDLGAGDIEGPGQRDFAPRCVQRTP